MNLLQIEHQTGWQAGILEGKREGILEGQRKGKREGILEGQRKGKREGILEGQRKGKWEAKKIIAVKMLKQGFPLKAVASITGLSVETLNTLVETV